MLRLQTPSSYSFINGLKSEKPKSNLSSSSKSRVSLIGLAQSNPFFLQIKLANESARLCHILIALLDQPNRLIIRSIQQCMCINSPSYMFIRG